MILWPFARRSRGPVKVEFTPGGETVILDEPHRLLDAAQRAALMAALQSVPRIEATSLKPGDRVVLRLPGEVVSVAQGQAIREYVAGLLPPGVVVIALDSRIQVDVVRTDPPQ